MIFARILPNLCPNFARISPELLFLENFGIGGGGASDPLSHYAYGGIHNVVQMSSHTVDRFIDHIPRSHILRTRNTFCDWVSENLNLLYARECIPNLHPTYFIILTSQFNSKIISGL